MTRAVYYDYAELRSEPIKLQPGMVCSGNRNGTTSRTDHLPTVYRPGALDALKCPSRMGDMLHYPDGRVERVEAVPAAQAPTGYGGAA